jgi:hypothetical protein
MFVFNENKDKWLGIYAEKDLVDLYTNKYNHRDETYYDSPVPSIRKEYVTKYTNLKDCVDFGCGNKPFGGDECLLNYDPFVKEFSNFSIDLYKEARCILAFDVLEHLFDLSTFIRTLPHSMLICSLPIVPDKIELSIENPELLKWKHFRPGEHLYYFRENGFIEFCKDLGWSCIYNAYDECPPREDIGNFVFVRV